MAYSLVVVVVGRKNNLARGVVVIFIEALNNINKPTEGEGRPEGGHFTHRTGLFNAGSADVAIGHLDSPGLPPSSLSRPPPPPT